MPEFIEQYQQGYEQLLAELDGLSTEQISFKPSDTSWSIREIVIHVADTEMVHIYRMKAILAEDNPILTAFDQNQWTAHLDYQHLDIHPYLLLFSTLRESFLPILKSLKEQDFARKGMHNQVGELTFKEIFIHSIEHVTGHLAQIRRVKATFPKSLSK